MKRKNLLSILSVCLILSACNLPGASAPNSSALSTAAAQTVQAVLTPQATQAPAGSPAPPACEDVAMYTAWTRDNVLYDVKEVEKRLAPGKVFTMSWTLQNTGTCTWDDTYLFHFDSGTQLTEADSFPVLPTGAVVPPGGTVTVTIPMTAPEETGEYDTVYRLQTEGREAAINLVVTTKVGNASTSLKSPGDLRYTYDCTSGSVNIGLTWVDRTDDEDGYRIYRDGDLLADLAAGSTTYSDIAPGSGKYDYTVASYNTSGESPTTVKVNTENCQ